MIKISTKSKSSSLSKKKENKIEEIKMLTDFG
jgi:hypothetical protein